MTETQTPEIVDEQTGELLPVIPVRQVTPSTAANQMGVGEYKPTTLLDYSALMMAARMHPRDTTLAIKQAMAICTTDEETAKECFYALPRAGKSISGPSIGMAETLASCYGNMNITVDDIKVDRDEGIVEVRGFILDCETGLTTSDKVRRNIRYGEDHKTRAGQIYNEDMIGTTAAAARSILYRNLVLRIIPRPLVRKIYNAALAVSMGGKTFGERQAKCVKHWEEDMGVPKAKLLNHLEHTQISDINIKDFEYLLGIENAIREGTYTVDKIFSKDLVIPEKPGSVPKSLDEVSATLAAREETEKEPEPEEVPEPVLSAAQQAIKDAEEVMAKAQAMAAEEIAAAETPPEEPPEVENEPTEEEYDEAMDKAANTGEGRPTVSTQDIEEEFNRMADEGEPPEDVDGPPPPPPPPKKKAPGAPITRPAGGPPKKRTTNKKK